MKIKYLYSLFVILMPAVCVSQHFDQSQLDDSLNTLVLSESAPGISVLISTGGKEHYYFGKGVRSLDTKEKITPESRFRMASVSKQVTALAIYCLIERQQLALQDTLGLFFKNLSPALTTIKVQQLLNHSSGVPDYENRIPERQKAQIFDGDVLALLGDSDSTYFEPGSKFKYSNTAYCLLALIVEQVSGRHFADFVQHNLFDPAGIKHGLVYSPDSHIIDRVYGYHPVEQYFVFADQSVTSATKGDGGVYFSAEDYHRWANFIVAAYFSKKDFQKLFFKHASAVSGAVIYNFGFFAVPKSDGGLVLFHSGESTGFNNIIYIDISRRFVISAFSNRDDFLVGRAFGLIMQNRSIASPAATQTSLNLFEWLSKVYEGQGY